MWPDPDQLSVSGWSLERVWCCVSVCYTCSEGTHEKSDHST